MSNEIKCEIVKTTSLEVFIPEQNDGKNMINLVVHSKAFDGLWQIIKETQQNEELVRLSKKTAKELISNLQKCIDELE